MKNQKSKVYTCCLDCGTIYGTKSKEVFGVWNDKCDICKKENVTCASASHDFGIYSHPAMKEVDEVQDMI